MQASGKARSETDIVDLSVIVSQGFRGITAVKGLTQWGDVETPKLISTWDEFVLNFGGYDEQWAAPVGTNFPLLCQRALNAGAKLYVSRVASYTTSAGITTVDGSAPTGGVDSIRFNGKYIGNYNVRIDVTQQTIAGATTYSVTETPLGSNGADYSRFARTVDQLPLALTDADIKKINATFRFSILESVAGSNWTVGSFTLSGGVQNVDLITNASYIGVKEQATGLYAFDEITFDYLAIPDKADPELDNAMEDYANLRKDFRCKLRTPVGVDSDYVIEYRNQTGPYANARGGVDTWLASMSEGGIIIKHPVTGELVDISEIGDVIGRSAKKDNDQYPWYAAAGAKRGTLNCLGVVYNVGTNARRPQADAIDRAGVNMVINHNSFGPVIWGNATLQRAATLLQFENVADCVMYITKVCKPVIERQLFDPNDLDTWKTIYREVKKVMDVVKDNRGVWDWLYQGDQDAADISECVVNQPENIDAGMYVFYLWIQPKVAMKYVYMKVMVTNSGVDFEEAFEELEA